MSETLLLVDELEKPCCSDGSQHGQLVKAADELRRLHALNAELVEALTTCVCAMQDYQAGIGITEMFDKGERIGRAVLMKVGVSK